MSINKPHLPPCPFCGAPAKLQNYKDAAFYVTCTNSTCAAIHNSPEKAIEAWSRRASTGTEEQIVYNVAQRDPGFRKHLIAQLTAMGEGVDKGPLRNLPAPPNPASICAEMAREAAKKAAATREGDVFTLGAAAQYNAQADALREAERRIRALTVVGSNS